MDEITLSKRESIRINESFPVRFSFKTDKRTDNLGTPLKEYEALGKNVCENGIFIETPDIKEDTLLYLLDSGCPIDLNIALGEWTDYFKVLAQIVWRKGEGALGFGARFIEMQDNDKNKLRSYILNRLEQRRREEEKIQIVRSEPLNYKSREGEIILGFFDHRENNPIHNPCVIILSNYIEEGKNPVGISLSLVSRGFNVVRLSVKDIDEKENISFFLDFVQNKFNTSGFGILLSSLTDDETIWNLAKSDRRIKFFLSAEET